MTTSGPSPAIDPLARAVDHLAAGAWQHDMPATPAKVWQAIRDAQRPHS